MDPNILGAIGVIVGVAGGITAAFWRGATLATQIKRAIDDSARDLRTQITGVSDKVDSLSNRVSDVDAKVSYIRGHLRLDSRREETDTQ